MLTKLNVNTDKSLVSNLSSLNNCRMFTYLGISNLEFNF